MSAATPPRWCPVSDRLLRFPARGLGGLTSIAIAPVGDSSSRAIAAALAEGRRLELVAGAVTVELEALRLRRVL
jgi:hypothetical protein